MGSPKTHFSISTEQPAKLAVDGLIIPVFKKTEPKDAGKNQGKSAQKDPVASILWPIQLDKALMAEIKAVAADEKFDGSRGKILTIRPSTANKLKARRLIILGLGEHNNGVRAFQPRHWESNLQKAMGSLLGLKDMKSVAVLLPTPDDITPEIGVSLAVDAVYQATYKSAEAKDSATDLQKAMLITAFANKTRLEAALQPAEALAKARSFVKDLVNKPANLKSTETLTDAAKAIGKTGIKVTVQSNTGWIAKNMPCFYTVARGALATDPPKFITLQYTPKNGKAKKHIAVVGKSVIFDTGGYQVKPGDSMVTMKGDMTGGAVALATMQALAELQPKNVEVTAYLAATPNKIDSDAMIPDSIVNTTCGKKVEIRHTDAEGRLTLIDAVAKAVESKPDEMITIATLTGSASQAVGCYIALMGNNEELRERVAKAGRSLAEPIQTLDVTEEDYDNIKSKLDGADIINTSQKRQRGAQSAAAFVMSGAPESLPMAHMDIAGADMTPDEKATGIAVKTVLQYILNEDSALGNGRGPATKPASGSARTSKAKAAAPAKTTGSKPKAAAPKTTTQASAKTVVKKTAASKATAKKAAPKAVGKKATSQAKPKNRQK
jgi:leucyl aminopeptidase